MDIEINTTYRVKLTPKDNRSLLQKPTIAKSPKTIPYFEWNLLHAFAIFKSASPNSTQTKPIGNLRLLVEFRIVIRLIGAGYSNKIHSVSTCSDAVQHLAGKFLFCKLDCSQVNHYLQLAH